MSVPKRVPFGFTVYATSVDGKLRKMLLAKCFCGHCQYVHADWDGSLVQAAVARMRLRVRQRWDVDPKLKCSACKRGKSVEVGMTHAQSSVFQELLKEYEYRCGAVEYGGNDGADVYECEEWLKSMIELHGKDLIEKVTMSKKPKLSHARIVKHRRYMRGLK